MGAIDTNYTFTATDVITSTKMNNILDQSTITATAVFNSTLSIASGKLLVAAGGITSNELAVGAVTTTAITDLNVTTGKIADLAITTGKLNDLSVTTGKIADSGVTAVKIYAGNGTFPIKVQQVTKTDTQTITGGTWTDVASLSLSFTRVNATSKVRVQAMVTCDGSNQNICVAFRVNREGTSVGIPSTAGSRTLATGAGNQYSGTFGSTVALDFIDDVSAISTNPLTYKIQAFIESGYTGYINRGRTDTDTAAYARSISTMTLTELA